MSLVTLVFLVSANTLYKKDCQVWVTGLWKWFGDMQCSLKGIIQFPLQASKWQVISKWNHLFQLHIPRLCSHNDFWWSSITVVIPLARHLTLSCTHRSLLHGRFSSPICPSFICPIKNSFFTFTNLNDTGIFPGMLTQRRTESKICPRRQDGSHALRAEFTHFRT